MKVDKTLPEVRFEYAFLLSEYASEGLNTLWGDGTPLRSFDEYTEIVKKYAEWWKDDGDKIIRELCRITELEFYQNTIDVYVAPWFYAFSSPMVLGVTFSSKNQFINTLTHEIIHRLLTDNTTYSREYDFLQLWRSLFGDHHEWNTLVHIPVHAIMQKLYIDVLNRPDLLELDKKDLNEHGDKEYLAAWGYVEQQGYEDIIRKLKQHSSQMNIKQVTHE
jgi:hypothetical protein